MVEVKSFKGYSGSPVFVSPYPWSAYVEAAQWVSAARILGLDCGHLQRDRPVLDADGEKVPEKTKVRENSGLMLVVPARSIVDPAGLGSPRTRHSGPTALGDLFQGKTFHAIP